MKVLIRLVSWSGEKSDEKEYLDVLHQITKLCTRMVCLHQTFLQMCLYGRVNLTLDS